MSPTVMNDRGEGVSNYDGRVTVAELLRREGMTQELPVAGGEPASGWTGYDDYTDETPTDLIPVAEILRRENADGQATQFFPHRGGFEPVSDPYPREDGRESITELYGREDGLENVVGLYGHGQAADQHTEYQTADQHTEYQAADQYTEYEDERRNVSWFQRHVEQAYGEDAAGYSDAEEPAQPYADEDDDPDDEEFTRLYAGDDHDDEVAELLPRTGQGERRRAGKIGAVAAGVVALAGLAVAAFGAGQSSPDSVPPLAGGLGGGPVDPSTSASSDPSLLPNGPLSSTVPGARAPEGSASTSGTARPGVPGLTGTRAGSRPLAGPQTTTDRPAPTSSSSSAGNAPSVPSSTASSSPSSPSPSASSTTQNASPTSSSPSTTSNPGPPGWGGGVLGGVKNVVSGTIEGVGGAAGGLLG